MEQHGAPWHEFRRNHIQASDAIKIWEGKDADLMEIWERLNGIGDEILPNDAMLHGRRMEPIARDFFNNLVNGAFWPDVVECEKHKFLGASLDGINFNRDAIVEIKCPYSSNMLQRAKNFDIDLRYQLQMTHQMIVTGIRTCFFFVYEDEENYFNQIFLYNTVLGNDYLEKARAFWTNHVETNIPPIQERKDSEWADLERWYWEICEEERRIKVEKENCLEKLKMLSSGKSAIGPTLMLSKYMRKGNIDYGKIAELSNVNLEEYRKESSICWRAKKR